MANKLTELGERIGDFNTDLFTAAGRMSALVQERADILTALKDFGIAPRQATAMLGTVNFTVSWPEGFDPNGGSALQENDESVRLVGAARGETASDD